MYEIVDWIFLLDTTLYWFHFLIIIKQFLERQLHIVIFKGSFNKFQVVLCSEYSIEYDIEQVYLHHILGRASAKDTFRVMIGRVKIEKYSHLLR